MAIKESFHALTRAPATLGGQVRSSLNMANHRLQHSARHWASLPAQIPSQLLDRIAEAVRQRLDIPSRAEITALVSRLEAVDSKISALEAMKVEPPAHAAPAATKTAASDANRPRRKNGKTNAEATAAQGNSKQSSKPAAPTKAKNGATQNGGAKNSAAKNATGKNGTAKSAAAKNGRSAKARNGARRAKTAGA